MGNFPNTSSRDNNFNLLRFLGATVVVFAHGYNVKSGRVESDQAVESFIYTFGFRALDLFFIFSGFLIAASLVNRGDAVRYWVSRFLRIFPALIFVSIAIVFTIGPLNTTYPTHVYFFDAATWMYPIVTGLTTYPDMPLPGVFAGLPVSDAVNRPIWTLRYELILYSFAFFSFVLGILNSKKMALLVFVLILFGYGVITFSTNLREQVAFIDHFSHFSLSFALGVMFFVFRSNINLSSYVVLLMWTCVFLVSNTRYLEISTIVASGYTYFWLAYCIEGSIRSYNKIGDYSYGLYIIHWPIAQTIITLSPEMSPLLVGTFTFLISVPLAILCWHFIEAPALSKVDDLTETCKSAIGKSKISRRKRKQPNER